MWLQHFKHSVKFVMTVKKRKTVKMKYKTHGKISSIFIMLVRTQLIPQKILKALC